MRSTQKERKRGGDGRDGTGDEIHVAGDDALVVAGVVLLAGLGGEAGAMAAVVDEEEVAGLAGSDEMGEGAADVLAGGLDVGVVGVDEDGDVVLGEAVALDEAAVHLVDVVDAAFELSLGALVVATDQQRFPRHFHARFLLAVRLRSGSRVRLQERERERERRIRSGTTVQNRKDGSGERVFEEF